MSDKRFCPLAKLYRTDYELENGSGECEPEKCAWTVKRVKGGFWVDTCVLEDIAQSLEQIAYLS